MSLRIGYGFDSHSFKEGVPLVIGGLKIEHHEGLAGHSDGDVLLHAITDALLGAVSAGDIGSFFPPSDARWKNADSSIFLSTALEEIAVAGYRIVNLDTVLVLAAPEDRSDCRRVAGAGGGVAGCEAGRGRNQGKDAGRAQSGPRSCGPCDGSAGECYEPGATDADDGDGRDAG